MTNILTPGALTSHAPGARPAGGPDAEGYDTARGWDRRRQRA